MKCHYCNVDLSVAEENEHTKGHALALCQTGKFTVKEVAHALHTTPGRISAYLYNAGLRMKLFKRPQVMACGAIEAEVRGRDGFSSATGSSRRRKSRQPTVMAIFFFKCGSAP